MTELEIDHTKPMVILDEQLDELANSFNDHILMLDIDGELPKGFTKIATVTHDKKCPFSDFYYTFVWDAKLRDTGVLSEVKFENNLDSVIDYDSFTSEMGILSALLECVRSHLDPKQAYMVERKTENDTLIEVVFEN